MSEKDALESGGKLAEAIAEAGAECESNITGGYERAKLQILFDQLTYLATCLTKCGAYLKKWF
ncbi:MAG: hypothetical protein WA369_17835 [Candidatus Acidiferrales bacterium]